MPNLLPTSADLLPFLPEVAIICAIILVLLIPILSPRKNILAVAVMTTLGFTAAFLLTIYTRNIAVGSPAAYFGNLLLLDPFAWAVKLIMLFFTLIVMALWFTDSHDKFLSRGQAGDAPEFFTLLLSATLGLLLMVQTTNLLMIFLAIEMASLPSYVLAGFRKAHRVGAEAAMKYVLFGAASAAVMLYGMSLLYGLFGTLDLHQISLLLADPEWIHRLTGSSGIVLALGIAGLFIGVGFKIAMVPVHFWCPDVFEGASIDVTTFLSVTSKAAGLAMMMRILVTLTSAPHTSVTTLHYLAVAMLIIGTVTCFWGNLAAYPQNNIKRLLAWSSVAHAGYMLIGMSALVLTQASSNENLLSSPAAEALLFYLFMYLFMNAGAFVTAAAIAQRLTGPTDAGMSIGMNSLPPDQLPKNFTGEDIRNYANLGRRAPILAACMLVFLLSLVGIPLTIGFATKIKLFSLLFAAGPIGYFGVAAIGINTVIGAFYYFRIIRQMYLTESDAPRIIEIAPVTIVAMLLVIPNILFFLGYEWINAGAHMHAELLTAPAPVAVETPAAPAAPPTPAAMEQ